MLPYMLKAHFYAFENIFGKITQQSINIKYLKNIKVFFIILS